MGSRNADDITAPLSLSIVLSTNSCTPTFITKKMTGACGFEEEFVNPADEDYHCAICKFPAKEPVQTRCGHRFCRGCMEENMKRYAGHG